MAEGTTARVLAEGASSPCLRWQFLWWASCCAGCVGWGKSKGVHWGRASSDDTVDGECQNSSRPASDQLG